LVVRVYVVASQARKRDVADWRAGGIALAWVVWLRADVGVCRDWNAASACCWLGAGGGWLDWWGRGRWAGVDRG
jgi:hypothetical protein